MKRFIQQAGFVAAIALIALLTGCDKSNEWTVEGRIENAGGKTMYIEASTNGRWYVLDSLQLPDNGKFAYSHKAMGFPDIFRLRLDDRTLYFPIDSIETVTVSSKADAFDQDHTLSGSPEAERMLAVDKMTIDAVNRLGSAALGDSLLKRDLASMLLTDPAGIVSYYIINKRIGGVAIFNPTDRRDLGIIGAVANAYLQQRPGDPRTPYLEQLYLSNFGQRMREKGIAPRDTVVAGEIGLFDITLYDDKGVQHRLSDLVRQGKTVLLNFTLYAAEGSPAFNAMLNDLYRKYHDKGLEIYQISVDDDEFAWNQSARNLPWITVWNSAALDGNRYLLQYNVQDLPTCFIITPDGEVGKRVTDMNQLDSAIAGYLR